MPGYIIHLCHAHSILNELNIKKSEQFYQDFLTGCLFPDATNNKELTHFRPSWQSDKITKYPDLSLVTDRFSLSHMTTCDFGILAHLMLDREYVANFWDDYFRFEDKSDNITTTTSQIHHVRMTDKSLQPASSTIPFGTFFTREYFYGEYDATNSSLIQDYHVSMPLIKPCSYTIIPPDACDFSKLNNDIMAFFYSPEKQCSSKIFPYEDIKELIARVTREFITTYSIYL
jgi:hypothetical protein